MVSCESDIEYDDRYLFLMSILENCLKADNLNHLYFHMYQYTIQYARTHVSMQEAILKNLDEGTIHEL